MNTSPFAYDVTQSGFEDQVLRKSHEVPVLVDFWAAWCGPCKMLMPVLARLAEDYGGKFLLAKVDTEAEPALAQRFGIRSIPTVKLFHRGQEVDGFQGAQPEKTIRALLDRHIPRASDALVAQAREHLLANRPDAALTVIGQAVQNDPSNERAALEHARILIALERFDEAAQRLATLPYEIRTGAEAAALMGQLEFARLTAGAPPLADLERTVAADPANHEARYRLAARRIVAGEFDGGLAALLEIVRRDRHFRDDAARKGMLAAFALLGGGHELVKKYRALLASALN